MLYKDNNWRTQTVERNLDITQKMWEKKIKHRVVIRIYKAMKMNMKEGDWDNEI
jgi:ribosomal protein S17